MVFGIAYAVGYFVLAVVAMNVRQWRRMCIGFAAATIILFIPVL